VECGFLTNAGDARMLNQPYSQQRIAAAIAEGVADYFGW
jgi:N-acetylmuramoyl-L-alanine amidase